MALLATAVRITIFCRRSTKLLQKKRKKVSIGSTQNNNELRLHQGVILLPIIQEEEQSSADEYQGPCDCQLDRGICDVYRLKVHRRINMDGIGAVIGIEGGGVS